MFGVRVALLLVLAATLVSLVPARAARACTTGSLAVVAPQDVRLGGSGRGVLPFRRNVRSQLAPRAAIVVPQQQIIVPHTQTLLVPQQQIIVPQQQTLLLVR